MARFGEVLFSGSRFIFWSLSPFLLLFAIGLPLMTSDWSAAQIVLVVALGLTAILLVLALYDRKRFRWAGRVATAIVFSGYSAYLATEVRSGDRREVIEALLGLLIIGLPCLRYTLIGRFGSAPEAILGIRSHLVGICPQCGFPLHNHDSAMFACTIANGRNKSRMDAFLRQAKAHDWQSLKLFSDLDATQDALEAYVIRCSSGGMLFVLWNPFELYDSDWVYSRESIASDEMTQINEIIPAIAWQR